MKKLKNEWMQKLDEAEALGCFCFVVFKINQYSWSSQENVFCYCSNKNDILTLFNIVETRFGEFTQPRLNYKATVEILYAGPGVRLIPVLSYRWFWGNEIKTVLRYQTLFQNTGFLFSMPIVNNEIAYRTNDFACYRELGNTGFFITDFGNELGQRMYLNDIKEKEKPLNQTYWPENTRNYLAEYQYTEETRPPWLTTYESVRQQEIADRALWEEDEYYDDGGV